LTISNAGPEISQNVQYRPAKTVLSGRSPMMQLAGMKKKKLRNLKTPESLSTPDLLTAIQIGLKILILLEQMIGWLMA
jgi:hypothetical protein